MRVRILVATAPPDDSGKVDPSSVLSVVERPRTPDRSLLADIALAGMQIGKKDVRFVGVYVE